MTIQEMHYDFKVKLNKIDSQQYRNLLIPEIDWLLNSATLVFIKMNYNPRYNPIEGFELRQRSRENIKNLVVNNYIAQSNNNPDYPKEYVFLLPRDYLFYVSAKALMYRDICGTRAGRLIIRQHDDEFNKSPFDNSSYEWREVNATFFDGGIKAFTDGTFSIPELNLNYIRNFRYIHYAQGYLNVTYTNLRGETLTGVQNCELSDHTHSEIVDIAVLLATQNLQIPDYQLKLNKLKLT